MPIEGIIEGLKEAVNRHPMDALMAEYVEDAIKALTEQDNALDEAYKEGKRQQLEECYEMALKLRREA